MENLRLLINHSNSEVVNMCVSGIGLMVDHRDSHLLGDLNNLLKHDNLLVRLSAIEAIGNIKNTESVSVLLNHFPGEKLSGKLQIITALGKIADRSTLPFLQGYLIEVKGMDHSVPRKNSMRGDDPHPDLLRIVVEEAIRSITQ